MIYQAHQVVGVLSAIVNDKDQFTMNKTFHLLIRGSAEDTSEEGFEEFFRLAARPTTPQPGNTIVFLRPRGKKPFNWSANSYQELNGALRGLSTTGMITERLKFSQIQHLSQGILSNSLKTTERLTILLNLLLKCAWCCCLRSLDVW